MQPKFQINKKNCGMGGWRGGISPTPWGRGFSEVRQSDTSVLFEMRNLAYRPNFNMIDHYL